MHRMGIQHSHYIQDRGILLGSYRSILRMEGLRVQLGLLEQLGELGMIGVPASAALNNFSNSAFAAATSSASARYEEATAAGARAACSPAVAAACAAKCAAVASATSGVTSIGEAQADATKVRTTKNFMM